MHRLRIGSLVALLMLATSLSGIAQNRGNRGDFYDGVRSGTRGSNYDQGHDHGRFDERDRRYQDDRHRDQGGIGPGKGALIGAGGGAILGALLGGGLKGTIVGGAAGAGIGAIAGKAHQDNRRRDDRYGR
jgi:hypothetical protein